MKNVLKLSFLLITVFALVFTSCKDEDSEKPERQTDAEFQTLKTYLVDNSMDLSDILASWIVPAATLNTDLDDNDVLDSYHVLDIRASTAYEDGHIPGAVNCAYADVLDSAAVAPVGKTIVVACYSGQTAGHAVCALRLSGYPTAQVLMWGMSGWHTSLDSWSGSCATLDHANWMASPGSIVDNKEFADPDITETGDGATILAARVQSLLTTGTLRGVTGVDVLNNPGNYFINNYWAETDVQTYGNIAGAYRINPLTLDGEEYIHLDPSKDVVTYCWTGQTSSVITAYLYVIGYNSHSLKNGANSMIYNDLTGHKWNAASIIDLPLESSVPGK